MIPEVNAGRPGGFSQPQHHREPELLHHPDAGGAQALHDEVGIARINVATYQSVSRLRQGG